MASRARVRGLLIILAVAAIGVAIWFSPLGRNFDAREMLRSMRRHADDWWMIPVYFAAYAILDVLFIPAQFLSIAAPLMWGWRKGGLIELIAATVGSIFPYFIARSALREWVAKKLQRTADPEHAHYGPLTLAEAGKVLEREGFTFLLLLRLVPIIPYTPLNYLAGMSSVRPMQYLIATLAGIIPSTFIFAYFVQAVADGAMSTHDVMMRAIAAGTVLAILIIATRLAAPLLRRRMRAGRTASPPDDGDRGSDSQGHVPG